MIEPNTEPLGFALNKFSFECAWCESVNDSRTAKPCSCIGVERTLTCSACGRCLCAVPPAGRSAFLTLLSAAAIRRSAAAKEAFPQTRVAPEPALQRPVILVVDDDKVVHLIAKKVLAVFGGTVLLAQDGATALEMALQSRPDLVITDALLPKLDGRELARTLKTTAATSNCKVAVMTAMYKGVRYRAEAFKTFHVDEYVEKPVTAGMLLKLATTFLGTPINGVGSDLSIAS